MNEAKTLLEAGDLKGAIEAALAFVKSNPTNPSARIFLFELSIFAGDWERAKRQLDVIGHQDTTAMIGSKILEQCVLAEGKRADFFAKGEKPTFLASPPDYIYGLLTANNRMIEGNLTEAQEIFGKIDEQRPALACKINGEPVADFRDFNDSTSVVLEVIIKDDYLLVPFEQIERITFSEPKSLRDYFWRQATLETDNGTNGEVFVPTLYNDSWRSGDDRIRLGKATDWRDVNEDIYVGEGAKLFAVGSEHKTIFDLQTIEFINE
jgi:type VI secretion system protein ImpE